jgi:hypothetical protein
VVNISDATIKGFELQAQAKLGGFGFDGGIAYVDSSLAAVDIVNQRILPQIGQPGSAMSGGCSIGPAGLLQLCAVHRHRRRRAEPVLAQMVLQLRRAVRGVARR